MCAFVYLYVDMFMLCIYYFLSLNTTTTKPFLYCKMFDSNNIRGTHPQLESSCAVAAFLT